MVWNLFDPDDIEDFRDLAGQVPEAAQNVGRGALMLAAQQFCRSMAGLAGGTGAYGQALRPTIDYMCGSFYDLPGNTPGSSVPPFLGGQCPFLYDVSLAGISGLTGDPETISGNFYLGPIGSIRYIPTVVPGNFFAQLETPGVVGGPTPGWATFTTVRDTPEFGFGTWSVTSAVPADPANIDNCGNPPEQIVPPTVTNPYTPGDTEDGPGGYGVRTPAPITGPGNTVVIAPEFDVNIDIGVPDLPFDPAAPVIPELDEFLLDPLRGLTPEQRTGNSQPAIPLASGDDEDVPLPEPPDGFVYVGVRWELLNVPAGTPQLNNDDPVKIAAAAIGNIRLVVQDDGGNQWTEQGLIIRTWQGSIFRKAAALKIVGVKFYNSAFYNVNLYPIISRDERLDPALG